MTKSQKAMAHAKIRKKYERKGKTVLPFAKQTLSDARYILDGSEKYEAAISPFAHATAPQVLSQHLAVLRCAHAPTMFRLQFRRRRFDKRRTHQTEMAARKRSPRTSAVERTHSFQSQ